MIDWQQRFIEQLKWMENLRDYLYNQVGMQNKKKVLEVGCGTGALLSELGLKYNLDLYGIDINNERLNTARNELNKQNIKAKLFNIDIIHNDFEDSEFDVIVTNCLFLWLKDLGRTFKELHRLLASKGKLLIFAEPDYGGLIEYPNTNLKRALFSNLKKEGADPEVGRKLNQYFNTKFKVLELFCTSIPWISNNNAHDLLKEFNFFNVILKKEEFNADIMKSAIENNNYFIFIPVFSFYLEKI